MAKKNFIPQKLQPWIEARQKFQLTDAQIQMARELGLNPKKFGRLANCKDAPWKAPLPEFIEAIYEKNFGKQQPDDVRSIERKLKEKAKQKAAKKAAAQRPANESKVGDCENAANHTEQPVNPPWSATQHCEEAP